jgi:alcohol dehydrogenase (cytochrome c)
MTGTYDVDTHTLFWTTGNPWPDYDGSQRAGDNLYTCSVLALDPNTGKLKWHFQFTPHDTHDWDANETPVLIDAVFRERQRKLLIQGNRNAFFYVLNRLTGEFLSGKPFARQNWAKGLDGERWANHHSRYGAISGRLICLPRYLRRYELGSPVLQLPHRSFLRCSS